MNPADWSPLYLSIRTALLSAAIILPAGSALGWLASRLPARWRVVLDSICMLPLLLPPTVVGFGLLWIFGLRSPAGRLLADLGIHVVFTWQATVLASTLVAMPLMYRAARSAFELVDPLYLQAGQVLGLGSWRILASIQLPMAWPGLAGGLVLSFSRAMGEFGATMMVAGNIGGKTRTMPLAIYDAVQRGDYDQAMTWSLMLCALSWISILAIHFGVRVARRVCRRRWKEC